MILAVALFFACAVLASGLRADVRTHLRRAGGRGGALGAVNKEPGVLNKYSRTITEPPSQGASQAMLYGTGLTEKTINLPQVGICSVWFEGNPCNMHLLDLSASVKQGVTATNALVGYRFNTIGVSDGISMGTDGMSYSLQSRDIIADSIETTMGGQWYDALVAIPGCDKNMPGCLIAMGRLNRPALMVYGGTIRAGCTEKFPQLDIVSAFQSYGEKVYDRITEEERAEIVRNSCPGPGACGGMYTANTMATAIEALGMSLPFSSSTPADDPLKQAECKLAGDAVLNLLKLNLLPRDIMTKKAFENAIRIVLVLGGSTNAVLHLIAMARAVNVDVTLDDFQRLSDITPFLADLKPSGKYVMEDLQKYGGTPAVMRYLLDKGMLHGDCITVTGKTVAENLKDIKPIPAGNPIVMPLENPIKATGHLQILYGNLAPEGSVAKITGKEGLVFRGVAKVYDSEELMMAGLARKEITAGMVVVIRYEGPKGGPGMPEMLTPTSAIMGAGLGNDVALITDGRFSGGSHGFIIGHISPEAQEGGPIGLLKDGDKITIDAEKRVITVDNVSDAEMAARRSKWVAPPLKATRGTLYKYIKNVKRWVCAASRRAACVPAACACLASVGALFLTSPSLPPSSPTTPPSHAQR